MGTRALEFMRAHPDSEPGTVTAVARLEQLLARAATSAAVQREGLIKVHAAAGQKRVLAAAMRDIPIAHLATVGEAAGREDPELGKTFRFKPNAATSFAFRTAARSMANLAQEHRELLVKHGLSESVLAQFLELVDQYDAAVALGHEGRTAHVGATREIKATGLEVARTVRLMDGRNRQRFAGDQQLLGSWISASRVLGTPRFDAESEEGPPQSGGEARPAA